MAALGQPRRKLGIALDDIGCVDPAAVVVGAKIGERKGPFGAFAGETQGDFSVVLLRKISAWRSRALNVVLSVSFS
jgi:hypothetical protein